MLAANTYSRAYVEACRARVQRQLATYEKHLKSLGKDSDEAKHAAARRDFETEFFASLVLVLDYMFVHRTRAIEGKDGNAMNEVRMVASSILEHRGKLVAISSIKYDASRSVLGLKPGDDIRITLQGFRRLYDAFLVAVEERFGT